MFMGDNVGSLLGWIRRDKERMCGIVSRKFGMMERLRPLNNDVHWRKGEKYAAYS